jgi:membrane-bound metal-dependent hydrolase YbcI (DUF457 family)
MITPGHIATGYLATKGFLMISHGGLDTSQIKSLELMGGILGATPDLDLVFPFLKLKTLKFDTRLSHRRIFTHTPLFYLVLSTMVYVSVSSLYLKYLAIVFFISAISHFLADSIEYGIMWLWPFSKKQYALRKVPDENRFTKESIGNFYIKIFKDEYMKNYTFLVEILIITIALITYFRS